MDDYKKKMEAPLRSYSYDKKFLDSRVSRHARRLARTRFKKQTEKEIKEHYKGIHKI